MKHKDAMKEKITETPFESTALLPITWKCRAVMLKRASDKVFGMFHDASLRRANRDRTSLEGGEAGREEFLDMLDIQSISIYYLLMGYALENLLKGILVKQYPEYANQGSLDQKIKTHNLVHLFKECGLDVDPPEKELLEKLHEHIIWQGRYPVPLRAEQMEAIGYPIGEHEHDESQRKLNLLYDRLLKAFEEEIPDKETEKV